MCIQYDCKPAFRCSFFWHSVSCKSSKSVTVSLPGYGLLNSILSVSLTAYEGDGIVKFWSRQEGSIKPCMAHKNFSL